MTFPYTGKLVKGHCGCGSRSGHQNWDNYVRTRGNPSIGLQVDQSLLLMRTNFIFLIKRFLTAWALFLLAPFALFFFIGEFSGTIDPKFGNAALWLFVVLTYCYLTNFVYAVWLTSSADVCILNQRELFAMNKHIHLVSSRWCPWLMRKNSRVASATVNRDGTLTITTANFYNPTDPLTLRGLLIGILMAPTFTFLTDSTFESVERFQLPPESKISTPEVEKFLIEGRPTYSPPMSAFKGLAWAFGIFMLLTVFGVLVALLR